MRQNLDALTKDSPRHRDPWACAATTLVEISFTATRDKISWLVDDDTVENKYFVTSKPLPYISSSSTTLPLLCSLFRWGVTSYHSPVPVPMGTTRTVISSSTFLDLNLHGNCIICHLQVTLGIPDCNLKRAIIIYIIKWKMYDLVRFVALCASAMSRTKKVVIAVIDRKVSPTIRVSPERSTWRQYQCRYPRVHVEGEKETGARV